LSPRNRAVAEALRKQGSATLLFDLLTSGEESEDAATGHLRFDVDLLAHRLIEVAKWAGTFPLTCNLPVGFFGASTGGAAALLAAAALPSTGAVVIRGGRPDLAAKALPSVRAATLLIVGEYDRDVLALNQEAFASLRCDKELVIVPRASHLFSERGALSEVSALAAMWFQHAWESAGSAPAQRRFGPDT
jgi:dienelactone hydrolase